MNTQSSKDITLPNDNTVRQIFTQSGLSVAGFLLLIILLA